jgi:hypothetical protein
MATISKTDADTVSKFLSHAINEVIVPFATNSPSSTERALMEELGIAGHPSQIGGMQLDIDLDIGAKHLCEASGSGILVENNTAKQIKFSLGGQLLTTSGHELIPIAGSPTTDFEFLKEIAENIRSDLERNYGAGSSSVQVVTIDSIDGTSVKYTTVFTVP